MTITNQKKGVWRLTQNGKVRGTATHLKGEGNFTGTIITAGKEVDVFDFVENVERTGEVWGIITDPAMHVSQTLYICIKELNNIHAVFVRPFEGQPASSDPFSPDSFPMTVQAFGGTYDGTMTKRK